MTRSLVIAFIAFLLSINSIMAQNCEPNMYFFPLEGIYSSWGISMDTTMDQGHISATSFYNSEGATFYDIKVIKSDVFGNEVWSQSYNWGNNDNLVAIKQLLDGSYIILGSTRSPFYYTTGSRILLLKIDTNGELLWTSALGTGANTDYQANDIEILPDGGFLIIGSETEQDEMVMMKTDANGNLIAQNSISPWVINVQNGGSLVRSRTTGGNVYIAANGDYIFSGTSLPRSSIWPAGGYMTVVRTTPDFDTVWESVSSFSYCYPPWPRGVVEYEDGSLYITTTSNYGCPTEGTVSRLFKLDEDGNVLWSDSLGSDFTGDVLIAPDGNLILSKGNGIMKVDTSGAVIWQSPRVPHLTSRHPNTLKGITQSGGYMLACESQDKLALVEFDSLGNHCTSNASGIVYIDSDQDCTRDGSEILVENAIVEVTPGNLFANTNGNGFFQVQLDTGSFNLQLHPPNALWEVGCPLTTIYDISFPIPYLTEGGLDFGLHALEDCALLNVDVSLPRARVCTEQIISVRYCNNGTLVQSDAEIEIQLNEELEFLNASIAWTQSDDTYNFGVGDLGIGECGQFTITIFVNCDGEIGNIACVTASILPENTCTLEEGHGKDVSCRVLTNSYDPNDKLAAAADTNNCWETNLDELAFTVRFQNTGNDTAFRVVIIDTLSSDLDMSTVRPGPSSHSYDFKVSRENQLMFVFNNINLLDSTSSVDESQGFVQFFVHPKSDISEGTVIENQAAIYFDTNDPIFTPSVQLSQCNEVSLTVVEVVQTAMTDCLLSNATINILAIGGEGVYEYSINGGENWQLSSMFLGLLYGEYDIWVRDEIGNLSAYYRNPVEIENPGPIILNVLANDPSSSDVSDGSLEIFATGADDILYSVDEGGSWQPDALFTGLAAGVYYPWISTQDTTCIVMGDPITLIFPTNTLDFEDDNIQSLILYPNPTSQVVKLDIQLKQLAEIRWKLIAVSGVQQEEYGGKVKTTHLEDHIMVEDLAAGIYIIHINIDGSNYVKRLVVY
ncbi:MAG: hypothetical protein DHS20C18_25260 [Saprospiraceae bacterium]|nr:MAG: hypothetical protein DHS20C18_25260 [Saprospiraceae bacterium]